MRLLSLVAPPLCVHCRVPVAPAEPLCWECRRRLEHLGRAPVRPCGLSVWAPVAYEGPARAVVRRLKFDGAAALADHMAAAIVANAPAALLDVPVAPVPSPPGRRRRRGFCHGELLAEAVARRAGLPMVAVLRRVGDRRQVGRTRQDRLRAPPRFAATRPGAGEVLLVDDVVTTGATLAACAGALRAAGWRCRGALAYARTPVR